MKIILERQIKFAFILALLILLGIGFFAYRSTKSLNEAIRWEQHTREVLLELDETLHSITDAETSERGFVLTDDESFLEPYQQTAPTFNESIKKLKTLVADNPLQTENSKKLEKLAGEKLDFINRTIEIRRSQGFSQAVEKISSNQGKNLMDEIRRLVGEMKDIEKNLLITREANLDRSVSGASQMLFLGSIVGILLLGLANFAIFRETGKRREVENELRDTNKELETRVEKRTHELSNKKDELEVQIRQREQNENTLRQSENFARAILDSLPAQIAVVDKDGNIVEVNEAWQNFARINGTDEKLLTSSVGQNYLKICGEASGADEGAAFVRENLQAVLDGEKIGFSFEYPCHAPHEDHWFIMQVNAMREAGGAVVSHTDITNRKKAEIKLKNSEEFNRSIFENSPDCINVLELDGTFHSMNTNGLSLMEIEDSESFEGKPWIEYWKGDEKELAYQAVQTAIKGKTAHFEGFCETSKGNLKWWDISVAPVFDSKGKPRRLISTARDITSRRESEREREELLKREQAARKEAEIANRMRDEFLATVSHELRAPLNSILGWARLLEKGTLDETTSKKAVTTIVRNSEAQNRLIEDLLDVSRIISGKLRLEVMTVKPINIVESALETVRPAAEAKGIKLEIKEDADVSHISGDPNRLQQVIWNLLSNAIKFTPNEGEVVLEIERADDFVKIRVKDSGVGIKEEFLPHVFDRFRQADASSIRKFGGLGLGLAIVRHITEMHGGTVSARSEGENQGSTFTVKLPLVAPPREQEESMIQELNKAGVLETKLSLSLDGLLILVVDDEEDTRQLLVQSLAFYGATVETADSAENALTAIEDKNPDVLISDIGMPGEDGYTLIRKVRNLLNEHHKNIPAIALTAFTRAQDRVRALTSGYQNHVAKPVEPDELATVIASLTGRLEIEEIK
ncbi:MAG: CHASE3 domain-containing protein [Acidobacteria bacterium]|jgi:PAS domain S-box-containing protein|nr:CHASE3 domain-containing protein [Acidobacteriota bacterium]